MIGIPAAHKTVPEMDGAKSRAGAAVRNDRTPPFFGVSGEKKGCGTCRNLEITRGFNLLPSSSVKDSNLRARIQSDPVRQSAHL